MGWGTWQRWVHPSDVTAPFFFFLTLNLTISHRLVVMTCSLKSITPIKKQLDTKPPIKYSLHARSQLVNWAANKHRIGAISPVLTKYAPDVIITTILAAPLRESISPC